MCEPIRWLPARVWRALRGGQDLKDLLMDSSTPYSRVRLDRGRRLASPVRVALAPHFGGIVDGAWWPRDACLARELVDLIEALRQPLGAITDITLNWPSTEGTPNLDSTRFAYPINKTEPHNVHLHVMGLVGRHASANLLIVPCLTTSPLALMVLRRAAKMAISDSQQATETYRVADYIVRTAGAERAMCDAIALQRSS
jgi:Family of unknown function (DUF5994)